MKIRTDFVTNSSSSSYIVCFARVADNEKAKEVLDKYKNIIEIYNAKEVLEEIEGVYSWCEWLDCDWAGVYGITPDKEYIKEHMEDNFILIEQCQDIEEDPWGDTDYDVDYEDFDEEITDMINKIVEENGFSEIEIGYGAGRNG